MGTSGGDSDEEAGGGGGGWVEDAMITGIWLLRVRPSPRLRISIYTREARVQCMFKSHLYSLPISTIFVECLILQKISIFVRLSF